MRRVLVGLAGFAVIAFAASIAYADDGEAGGLSFSLDLNKLFGAPVQDQPEEKMEWKFKGWGQWRYEYSDGTYSASAGRPTGGNENIRVGRFRFLPGGKYKWLTWGCQYETYSSVTLLDAWFNINCPKYEGKLQLKAGQFIPPFGLQRPVSPYNILTYNYSKIVGYLFGASDPLYPTWGNLRDKGIMLHGKTTFGEGEGFKPNLYYALGIFAGEAANVDTNSDPAWTTFVTAKLCPADGILFGLSYEDGSRQWVDTSIPVNRVVNRDRFGLCWQFELMKDEESKSKLLLIQGEYIVGNHNWADMDKHDYEPLPSTMWHNKRLDVDGWYMEVGYFVKPKKLQLTAKVDILDLPAFVGVESREGNQHDLHYRKLRTYGMGFNYYLSDHCKMQTIWEQSQNEGRGKIHKISGSEHRLYVVFGVNF